MLEDDSRDGDEEDAPRQDEEQRGRHSDLGLTDLVVLPLERGMAGGSKGQEEGVGCEDKDDNNVAKRMGGRRIERDG